MKATVDEVLVKSVTKFGNSAHIPVPKRHIGKKAYVVISKLKSVKEQEILESIDSMYGKVMNKISKLEDKANEYRKQVEKN